MSSPSPSLIARVVGDAMEMDLPLPTPRTNRMHSIPGKIDAVVGMRRSGKTYLLYQRAHELIAAGIPRDRILYLNFEDERLSGMQTLDLQHIPEAYFARYPKNASEECHFFFDEIQNVPGWERFLRRLLDRRGIRLAVTGSSSRLLGTEIATALRGRSLTTELLPFSFEEVLRHEGVPVPERWPAGEASRALLRNRFAAYLEGTGFPEVQGVGLATARLVLQDYVNVALLRDVIERHNLTNVPALRWLVRRMVTSPGSPFTVHRVFKDLRAQGFSVAKDTVHQYVGWLADAFLVLQVPAWGRSERATALRPRKLYLVDHGLASAASVRAADEKGHLFENVVYTELRRRGYDCHWVPTESGYEVDFLAEDRDRRELVQACLDAGDPVTRDRELRSLAEAMRTHKIDTATVVTQDEESTLRMPAGTVRFVPAWRWLLGH